MKKENTCLPERDVVFSAVLDVMNDSNKDSESNITKIVKAIAASGSYLLSFLNIVYSRLISVKVSLRERDYEKVEKEIDLLTKAISDIRKRI